MITYLFIESRDPFESRDTQFVIDTATALKQSDNEVTVFLVQNGVLAARNKSRGSNLSALSKAGVNVLADDFSLKERGIEHSTLISGIRPSTIDELVDVLSREN